MKLLKIILVLSAIGTVFATSVTIKQFVAPATEPGIFSCVGLSIWGLSPCPYGLAIFTLLTLTSIYLIYKPNGPLCLLRFFSVLGVVFSGWVVWRELCLPAIELGRDFWETFSIARVPACAWGFVFFLAVFIIQWFVKKPVELG